MRPVYQQEIARITAREKDLMVAKVLILADNWTRGKEAPISSDNWTCVKEAPILSGSWSCVKEVPISIQRARMKLQIVRNWNAVNERDLTAEERLFL